VGYEVEVRVRALLRHEVVEFSRRIELPFPPCAWLFLRDGEDDDEAGVQLQEVAWDVRRGCFVARLLDDVDAAGAFGGDDGGLKAHYEARGWKLVREGLLARLFLRDEPA
jgi:hypothetical protein